MIPRCEVCNSHLRFETDWIGRAYYIHEGPCVAKTHVVLPEEVPEHPDERRCEECGKRFVVGSHSRIKKLCSTKCSRAKHARRHAEREAERGKNWRLELLNNLNIPAKNCIECGRLFTAMGVNSFKQGLCSAMCTAIRQSRRNAQKRRDAA